MEDTSAQVERLRRLGAPETTHKVPLFLVEEHCEAMLCIHRAMRRGILPLEGISVVHFDAHPDLSLPRDLHPDTVFQPRELLQKLRETVSGIAEWMLPLVFAGHISRIVWALVEK